MPAGQGPAAVLPVGALPPKRSQPRLRLLRWLRVASRYFRLVATQFWRQVLIILTSLSIGTLLYHRTVIEALGRVPDWSESLFATYSLFALQPAYPLPPSWALRVMYFVYPLLGLLVVADTVVRVALLLFSRQENQKEWNKVLASTYRDHIILCGLGRVGYRILERLVEWHLDVVVIEKNEDSLFALRAKKMNVPLLFEDARQEESLSAAGVEHARTIVIATNDDLANVEIALDGRRLNPALKVVLRMFDEAIASKLADAFHLELPFSSAAIVAPLVAASVLDIDIIGSFTLEGRELFTARLTVGPDGPLIGQSMAELAAAHRLLILSRKPPNGSLQFNVVPSDRIAAGDCLVVHAELSDLRPLGKLLKRSHKQS